MPVAKSDKRVEMPGARADALLEQMEEVAGRYLEAIIPWVSGRFEADVAGAVTAVPEVTEGLGPEGLAGLRSGLQSLVARVPDLARRRAGAPGAWPHRWGTSPAPITTGLYGTKGAGGKRQVVVPLFLESRLRLLLGTSGHLLARHGYEHHVRRTFNRAYLRSDYHPPEYLSRSLEGHEEFHPLLAEYGDLCDEYAGALEEIARAGQERAARAAADAWKRA